MRTSLDHLLIRLATRHAVYVTSLPSFLSPDVRVEEADYVPGRANYAHRLVVDNDLAYHGLIGVLRNEQMLTHSVLETRPGWEWAIQEGSRTYEFIGTLMKLGAIAGLLSVAYSAYSAFSF